MIKENKITIKQFNEKYGDDAFQLALDLGFDENELLNGQKKNQKSSIKTN